MIIKPKTPRTEMQKTSIMLRIGADFIEGLAEREGVDARALDIHVLRFIDLSVRVDFNGDKPSGFEPVSPVDSVAEAQRKFNAYLDSTSADMLADTVRAIDAADSAVDATTGPAPLPEDAPAKKK